MRYSTLLYWEPGQIKAKEIAVQGATEVKALAGALLTQYRTTGLLPGIELKSSKGDSLSIAVSPDRWALVHTDAKLAQHCTKQTGSNDKGSQDVRWEEVTSVPDEWFIPKGLAVTGIQQWMTDGTRSPELPWSDQAF
jgi:hypothetical protein